MKVFTKPKIQWNVYCYSQYVWNLIYLNRLEHLLYGSVASLPSPGSNNEAWPNGMSLRFASLLHLGHYEYVNIAEWGKLKISIKKIWTDFVPFRPRQPIRLQRIIQCCVIFGLVNTFVFSAQWILSFFSAQWILSFFGLSEYFRFFGSVNILLRGKPPFKGCSKIIGNFCFSFFKTENL